MKMINPKIMKDNKEANLVISSIMYQNLIGLLAEETNKQTGTRTKIIEEHLYQA